MSKNFTESMMTLLCWILNERIDVEALSAVASGRWFEKRSAVKARIERHSASDACRGGDAGGHRSLSKGLSECEIPGLSDGLTGFQRSGSSMGVARCITPTHGERIVGFPARLAGVGRPFDCSELRVPGIALLNLRTPRRSDGHCMREAAPWGPSARLVFNVRVNVGDLPWSGIWNTA